MICCSLTRCAPGLFPVVWLFAAVHAVDATLVVGYDTSTNPSGGLAASESGSSVVSSDLVRGSGLNPGPGTSSFNSDGWDTSNASFADAIADQEFLTWGWTSSPSLALGRLELRYDRSSQGPDQMRIDLAVNGGAFSTVYTDLAVSTTGTDALNIDLTSFTGVTSAVFRLVAFGATNGNGTFDIENYQTGPNRGIAVFAVPEPASLTLMGVAALLFVVGAWRHRCQVVSVST